MDEKLAPSNITTHVLRGFTDLLDFLPWEMETTAWFAAGLGFATVATVGAAIIFIIQQKAF